MDLLLRDFDRMRHHGLLALRVGLGLIFVAHGGMKLMEGTDRWTALGGSLSAIGLPAPGPAVFWGFLAAITEFAGGVMLVLGLFFRPMLLALIGTMVVATLFLAVGRGAPWTQWSHPLTVGWVFISLLLVGPGRYSLDGDRSGGARDLPDNSDDQAPASAQ